MSSERLRIEITNYAIMAFLKSPKRDMEQIIKFWEEGVQGANALLSKQRLSEVQMVYEMMQAVWPDEKIIKDLKKKLKP